MTSPLPSRPIEPHVPARCTNPACQSLLEFRAPSPAPPHGSPLSVRCFACSHVFTCPFNPVLPHPPPRPTSPKSGPNTASPSTSAASAPPPPPPPPPRKSRLIGTQTRPLETEYYDLLLLTPAATQDDIKRSYRRLAIQHHPDKNLHDPTASERFKRISIAYQTLSDPELRKRYNEFGAKVGTPEGGYVDPEMVFRGLFGGERFVPIIGVIGLAREMKAAMQEGEDDEDEGEGEGGGGGGGERTDVAKRDSTTVGAVLSPEEKAAREEKARKKAAEKAAAREERVAKLAENLERKLSIFTESAAGPNDKDVLNSWKQICELEAQDLVHESYGYELLQTIGFVYLSKAKHHLASLQTLFGVGGWLHNVSSKYHVFSETVSTLRSAIELKAVFDQIQAAEKAPGGLSPEERKKLEEQAAEKGLQALFKGTKLEVESVLREVCDRVLAVGAGGPDGQGQGQAGSTGGPGVGRDKVLLRAIALQVLGEAYMGVKRDPNAPRLGLGGSVPAGDDSEYVKVETRASRERAGGRKA